MTPTKFASFALLIVLGPSLAFALEPLGPADASAKMFPGRRPIPMPPPGDGYVWVPPTYHTVHRQIWVPPTYQTVYGQVWCEPVYQTVTEQVWIPEQYGWRPTTTWEGGQ